MNLKYRNSEHINKQSFPSQHCGKEPIHTILLWHDLHQLPILNFQVVELSEFPNLILILLFKQGTSNIDNPTVFIKIFHYFGKYILL